MKYFSSEPLEKLKKKKKKIEKYNAYKHIFSVRSPIFCAVFQRNQFKKPKLF